MDPTQMEQRDYFRQQLTLGLISALKAVDGVQEVSLAEHQPCDNIAITSWEQRYSTNLPQSLKDFYLATDGFRLTWKYRLVGEVLPIGQMVINRIADLRRIGIVRHRVDMEQPTLHDLEIVNRAAIPTPKPQFGLRWKMFELDPCDGSSRVCLVFPPKPDPPVANEPDLVQLEVSVPSPQVWYLDRGYEWHFLAPNFNTYFRMMLFHLGLPQWQRLLTPDGPTPQAKQLINLIAPHLLCQERQALPEQMRFDMGSIDPAVFKSRPRGANKKADE